MARILGSLTPTKTDILSDTPRILKLQTPYMRGKDVGEVQIKTGTEIIDGIYGPKTEARVKLFQENNGLEPTGVVGIKTWNLLDKVGTPSDPARKNTLSKLGSSGKFTLGDLQVALKEAKSDYWDPLSTSQKVLYAGGTSLLLFGIAATIKMNN